MVDVTASLDAATQQVLALLAQIRLGNVRAVQAQDLGAADNCQLAPVPPVAAYGPDLLLLVDFAAPNATTNPKLTIQGLTTVPIQAFDGSAPAVGALAGKRLVGFSSVAGGGFAARLIGLSPAEIAAIVASLVPTIARPQAKANQVFYLATTGSDANPGTAAAPFLTPGQAVKAAQGYDYAGQFTAKIKVADGTYSGAGFGVSGPLVGSPAPLFIEGNTTNPANVLMNTTALASGVVGTPHCFNTTNGASINVSGFTVQSQNGNALYAQGTGSIVGYQNIIFGACPAGAHVAAVLGGEAILGAMNTYTISGSATAHFSTDGSGSNIVNNGGSLNVTLTGTPAFSLAFAAAYNFSNMRLQGMTFGGAATGYRYLSNSSLINTYGGGASYFPGSNAGSSGQTNYA